MWKWRLTVSAYDHPLPIISCIDGICFWRTGYLFVDEQLYDNGNDKAPEDL